jgi:nicotinamide-nucleotide amidase
MGEEMRIHAELEADLRAYFARRNRPMTSNNMKQATLINSARALPNPVGSAPGWWVERDGHIIIAMPGVPREMYRMWQEEATPSLRAHHGTGEAIIVSRTVKLIGIGESMAEDKIRHLLSSTNPTIGTYAKNDGIHLRLTAKAGNRQDALALVAPLEAKLRDILGSYVYGYDKDTPASVVADLLIGHKLSLATMETCTGGYVASAIMEDERYPAFLVSGFVTPTAAALAAQGVSAAVVAENGLGSMPAAEAMARAVRSRTGASLGLGITGAMPGGLDAGVIAPGTVNVALDDGEIHTTTMVFPTISAEVRRWAMLNSLNLVRLRLLGQA